MLKQIKQNEELKRMCDMFVCPPVLYLIFNRPDLMEQSFVSIKEAQPAQLFIAADGPRPDREGEADLCAEARKIVKKVDWPCEVHTLFHDTNIGCRRAVSEAITWFFEQAVLAAMPGDRLQTADFGL